MAGQRGVVDQDAVVANDAVMTDVGVGHDQVMVAQGRFGTILNGATVNRHAFADHVVIANDQTGFFTFVLEIGRVLAYRRKLVDAIVPTDPGRPFEYHMGTNHRNLADFHTWADDRPWADLDIRGQNARRIDDCARVNQTNNLETKS